MTAAEHDAELARASATASSAALEGRAAALRRLGQAYLEEAEAMRTYCGSYTLDAAAQTEAAARWDDAKSAVSAAREAIYPRRRS